MRPMTLLFLILSLAGISAAQDTNFPSGPQYLMNFGSPQFFHSIETPSLSLEPTVTSFPANETPVATTAEPLVPLPPDLLPIYYGYPLPEMNIPNLGEITISSVELPAHLPESIVHSGVTQMVDPQSLRERGYGVTLAQAALFWKTHKGHAAHVYTNEDVERLHKS
ncbi:MAG TPA: hypothetical protein VMG31_08665 [Verrucomicrobiae bacterium]|nr:hypothetical protein [Verrucomicrobiae bacterium]